jgi:phosphatidylserine decarboxylase
MACFILNSVNGIDSSLIFLLCLDKGATFNYMARPCTVEGSALMAKTLHDWLSSDVAEVRDKPLRWLSEHYFFRDPSRLNYSDPAYFFAPADGVILYVHQVGPAEEIVQIKGRAYSLRTALHDENFHHTCLVIGIFMTFYDVHINRVPYAGRLNYRELDTIGTFNYPMLDVEKDILEEIAPYTAGAGYLFNNQRVISRIFSFDLGLTYYVLQVADYDVDCITPFRIKQNQFFAQNQRFSLIRYGSQVDLIIPITPRWTLTPSLEAGMHVEAGLDPVVHVAACSTASEPTED